jgi:hypothetical protein
MPGLLPFYH